MKLYETYADEMADLIRRGELPPGARLPSVRQAKQQRKVSASTVFEAYNLLESRGMIHCRPRSGYYVNLRKGPQTPEPHTAAPAAESRSVAISDLVFEVLGSTRDVGMVPLGSAFPSPQLFPLDKLAKALTPQMRSLAPAQLTGHLTAGDEQLRMLATKYQAPLFRMINKTT